MTMSPRPGLPSSFLPPRGPGALLRLPGAVLLAGALLFAPGGPTSAGAQIVWQDLVLTGGTSVEAYRGNLAAVTVPAVDSTDRASAAVGEFGLRGGLFLVSSQERSLGVQLDAGLRQFVAGGFEVRDYAPREWVGQADLSYRESLGKAGDLWVQGGVEGRKVEDRPPMPLFIQPGYGTLDGRVRFRSRPLGPVSLEGQLLGEVAEYDTGALAPQLALLDRRAWGAEIAGIWDHGWSLRLHAGFRASEYPNQGTFDRDDPSRRDRAVSAGATWTLRSRIVAQVGVEGTVNRSNSDRPEYNALSLRGVFSAPLPRGLNLNLYALLTTKDYVHETEFARLVPGEEADNASTVYLELARPLMVNLDGAVRFGWNRAETDIGDSYFERFGTTILFRYRPWSR